LAEKRAPGYAALDVMERHLASRSFFVDERYTIADVALYAYTHVAHEGGFDLSSYENVNGWLERVRRQRDHVPMGVPPKICGHAKS
jgi:glutathione S-transferase